MNMIIYDVSSIQCGLRVKIQNWKAQRKLNLIANVSNYFLFLSNRTNFELKIIEFFELFCFCESIEWYIFEANKFRMNPVWFHPKFIKCLLFKKGQNVEVQVFFTINKKSTIFVRFYSNFQGLIYRRLVTHG